MIRNQYGERVTADRFAREHLKELASNYADFRRLPELAKATDRELDAIYEALSKHYARIVKLLRGRRERRGRDA